MINVIVNGTAREVAEGTTMTQLLASLNFALDGTAVAVNDEIVPKSTFEGFVLEANMKVDVFSLVAGG